MLKKILPKSEFSKNILTILTGATIAQAIPILVSPLLTRMYTPQDFGIFALYLSILTIISSVATGRYEMAIMLAEDEDEVVTIIKLIATILFSVSTTIMVVVVLFGSELSLQLGNANLVQWLYFLPLSILTIGLYQMLTYLLIRYKQFKVVSSNKVFATATNSSLQIYIGYVFESAFGFIVGRLTSNIVAIILVVKNTTIKKLIFKKNKSQIITIAKKYNNFPLYDIPSTLVNTCSSQLPILFINKYFSTTLLGFYSLMNKVILMPISILSKSILDVFKQKASEDYLKQGNCVCIYKSTLKKLLILGVLPFSLLALFGPEIFSLIFGEKWRSAGEFAQILSPLMLLKFIVSPLSYTFYIADKQRVDLVGQVMIFVCTIGSMSIGVFHNSISIALIYYSISVSVMYLIYLYLSYLYSKGAHYA